MTHNGRKGAIVGFGFIAQSGHVPAYAESEALQIVAVADPCPARREAAAKTFPAARIYDDYGALLAGEKGTIDFVDIAAPPYVHAEVARAALESGLHVLCEKPFTVHANEARALLQLAARQRRVIFPSHNYKFAPVVSRVNQILASGLIGTVHHVTLETFRATHARGVQEWNADWRRQKKFSGGGIAMDHGSHTFYLAFDWLRSLPTAITAKMSASNGYDTEDTFSAALTFPTGTASVHLTWRAGFRRVIYTIHGNRGAIRVEDDNTAVWIMDQPDGKGGRTTWTNFAETISSQWMDAGHAEWFGAMFEGFTSAIEARDYTGKEAYNALACVELIEAAYLSAADGCRERQLALTP